MDPQKKQNETDVHLTALEESSEADGRLRLSWPGLLDNSVAGGITSGDTPLETVIRECGKLVSRFCFRSRI